MPDDENISIEYAQIVSRGMNALLEKKREQNPQLHTPEFKEQLVKLGRKVQSKKGKLDSKN